MTSPALSGDSPGGEIRLLAAEAFPRALLHLSHGFVAVHNAAPRLAALFATQQRWILCHVALACHFEAANAVGPGLTRRGFGNLARRHGIASRNTAYAFFDEALKYDIIRSLDGSGSGRFVPAPATLSMLVQWYLMHFEALDTLYGGGRVAQLSAEPERMLAVIQPQVTAALLASPDALASGPLYTIFTWSDAGGLLMDRLIAGIDPEALANEDRLLTDVSSISHLAECFGLSRAHTSRKLSAAETMGGLGWSGRRGHSRIWISRGFYEEYAQAQIRKLLVLDDACSAARAALQPAGAP